MNRDFFVLDATISRTKESLRVLEDIARYSLQHMYCADEFRQIRQLLFSLEHRIGVAGLIGARGLVGSRIDMNGVSFPTQTLWALIRVNVARVAESFRVLEEFVRLYHPHIAKDVEDLRYKVYGLEKILLQQTPHYWLHQYDEEGVVCQSSAQVEDLVRAVDYGRKIIILEDPQSSVHMLYAKVKQIGLYLADQRLTVGNSDPVLFFLRNHLAVAKKLPVDGVLLDSDIFDMKQARWALGSNVIVGCYQQSVAQLARAEELGVDVLGYGPIFSADKNQRVGGDGLSDIVQRAEVPFFVFGGIHENNIDEVYDMGVKNIITH